MYDAPRIATPGTRNIRLAPTMLKRIPRRDLSPDRRAARKLRIKPVTMKTKAGAMVRTASRTACQAEPLVRELSACR
jgi:hypothetical protein